MNKTPFTRAIFPWQVYLSIFIARVHDQQAFLYNFHIFLVVRLHTEQISDLTSFPCQGKASMPDFPWQGKFAHYFPSTRAIFPCQGKFVKEKLLVYMGLKTAERKG